MYGEHCSIKCSPARPLCSHELSGTDLLNMWPNTDSHLSVSLMILDVKASLARTHLLNMNASGPKSWYQ